MAQILARLLTEFRTRGGTGFARFVAARLAQMRCDVLYEIDLTESKTAPRLPAGLAWVLVDRHSLGSPATCQVEAEVLTPENHAYRLALQGQDQLLALTDAQGRVRSYGFVVFESFYKRVLGEASSVPMISNCFTFAAQRGQGLYPQLLGIACHHLAGQGHRRAIITCAPDNVASVRGIEKAGFKRVKTLRSLVLVARWIAWQRSSAAANTAP